MTHIAARRINSSRCDIDRSDHVIVARAARVIAGPGRRQLRERHASHLPSEAHATPHSTKPAPHATVAHAAKSEPAPPTILVSSLTPVSATATSEASPPVATYLTQREAAHYLRVSIAYIRNSDCPKVLLPSGRGRRPLVRYVREDLDTWVKTWRVSRRVSQARSTESLRQAPD
jgi:hypothetical protein